MLILLLELILFAIIIGTQLSFARFNLWMERTAQKSSNLGRPADIPDGKYVSGLGTVLVTTIEEARDRISQIEYIFCSQLLPTFQSQFQSFQKIYSEARDAAELAYKEKEKDLLRQITVVQHENQQVLEQNQLLKLERENSLKLENLSCNRIEELEEELKQKKLEVGRGKKALKNVQNLLQSKASLADSYENTIKGLEEENNMLLEKQKILEAEAEDFRLHLMKKSKEVDELQSAVRDKTEEVEKRKKVQENLLERIDFQASEIMNNKVLLNKCKEENTLLAAEIDNLTRCVDELQKVNKKNNELEERGKLQEKLLKQADSFDTGRKKRGRELDEYENERKLLLDKQRNLEERVEQLQQSLHEISKESSEDIELHGKLLKVIEAKDTKIQSQKRKMMDLFGMYRSLKSQYLNLCTTYDHVPETVISCNQKDGSKTIGNTESPEVFREIENKTSAAVCITAEATKRKGDQDISESDKRVALVSRSNPVTPSGSNILITPKCPSSLKSCPPAGAKRPISYWRDTRSHQSHVRPYSHDDFLDTPLENIRTNSRKVIKEGSHDLSKPDPKNTTCDASDDETQNMNVDPGPEKDQMPPPKAGPSSFKFVGPARKKAEREKLKGVDCKQCKKFYDAVTPEAGKNSDGRTKRCEHHDGVSRHRYRYEPPSTPEGFWNIGFESEM